VTPPWRPIADAPRDGTRILVVLRRDLPEHVERWRGAVFVAEWPDVPGWLHGWNVAAPGGHGGWSDDDIAGWLPLPELPEGA
jgi:hypothetical protein